MKPNTNTQNDSNSLGNNGRGTKREGNRQLVFLLAMVTGMMAWIVPAVAQTGYSGVYYLSGNN